MTYGWFDFEIDEADEIPDKYILAIERLEADGATLYGVEEIAVLVHRTCDGKYPLDGELANKKRDMATRICDLLNEHGMEN